MFDDQSSAATAELMTIGYEGASIDDFVATLLEANVARLIDVRELPLSRKRGFSKRALKEAVEDAGIEYVHFKSLGDPKPGREAARAGDFAKFREVFSSHLKSDVAQDGLEDALPIVLKGGACLLCFERCHDNCHRTMVAEEMGKRAKLAIRHIGVRHGIASN